MKKPILLLSLLLIIACNSKNSRDTIVTDTTKVDSTGSTDAITTAQDPALTNWSTPITDASGIDTLFNVLVRKQLVRGKFGHIKVITDKVLDVNKQNDTRNLLGLLVITGEGQGYNTDFATEYATLAVFEWRDSTFNLIDYFDLGEGGSYGLRSATTDADSIMLTENRFAMMIHHKSSEEGAGDSGFRRDDAEIYVLINNKITKIFERTLDDFSFASNESDSYYERTTTTTIEVLPEKTNNLFNIHVTTIGDERQVTDEEDNQSTDQEKENEGDGEFRWNGTTYEKFVTPA